MPRLSSVPTLAVIGAGPAGLMAAETAAAAGMAVTVFDAMPTPARKFLLAGRGGLNITHSEDIARFLPRYRSATASLAPALAAFGPQAMRDWCAALGEPTTVGSSGRVFPRSFKASPLLRLWLRRLEAAGVGLRARHRWTGWTPNGALAFDTPDGSRVETADAVVLALGGASWPRLGSDGRWTAILEADGIPVSRLRPSNCGFMADWSPTMTRFAGTPLKSLALRFGDDTARGDAMLTERGLEGGAVYALSAPLRDAIAAEGVAVLSLDLRPDMRADALRERLAAQPARASLSTRLRKAWSLPPVGIALLQEARHNGAADTPLEDLVKSVPVRLVAPSRLAEAISSAGGVCFSALDADLMLKRRPGVFVAGEMLDWEAPTGGYLLQASFATGAQAGRGAARFCKDPSRLGRPGDQSSR